MRSALADVFDWWNPLSNAESCQGSVGAWKQPVYLFFKIAMQFPSEGNDCQGRSVSVSRRADASAREGGWQSMPFAYKPSPLGSGPGQANMASMALAIM
jgi:hypothetical protein